MSGPRARGEDGAQRRTDVARGERPTRERCARQGCTRRPVGCVMVRIRPEVEHRPMIGRTVEVLPFCGPDRDPLLAAVAADPAREVRA